MKPPEPTLIPWLALICDKMDQPTSSSPWMTYTVRSNIIVYDDPINAWSDLSPVKARFDCRTSNAHVENEWLNTEEEMRAWVMRALSRVTSKGKDIT